MHRRDLLKLLGATAAFAGWDPRRLEALLVRGGTVAAGVDFFTADQREAVAAFADLVIPATDTPGAVDVGTVEFVELIVSRWYDDAERARFMRGLAHLDDHAVALGGTRFAHAGVAMQRAILEGLQAEGNALRAADPEAPPGFFHQARGLVLDGYYTSEVGMREELVFVPIPGRYDGAAPLSEVTRGGGRG